MSGERQQVWVLLYHHKHGVDCSVFSSELAARQMTVQICLETLDDGEWDHFKQTEKARKEIRQLLNMRATAELSIDECKKIYSLYGRIPHEEYFEIDKRPIED